MKQFNLEIVTPEKLALSEKADSISVPTSDGQITILPDHVPLFSYLEEGEVKIVQKGTSHYLAIGGGFVEVTPEKVSVLVSRAYKAEELNEKAILNAKKQAEEALKNKPEGEDLRAAQALLRSSLVDLKVLRRRRHRSAT